MRCFSAKSVSEDRVTGSACFPLSWVPTLHQGPGEFLARFSASDDAACTPMQTTLHVMIQVTQSP
jgi:hypothetical protein